MVFSDTTLVGVKSVLAVGFPESSYPFDEIDRFREMDSNKIDLVSFENGFNAYQFLQKSAEQIAFILVYLPSMEEEKFYLTKKIQSQSEGNNSHIPVIGISPKGDRFSAIDVLRQGIDDVFYPDSDSEKIFKRVEFLNLYKDKLQKENPVLLADPQFKIPTSKRIFDIVGASLIILAISPILISIALAVKLTSKGPIIYRSKRVGTGYQVFDFLKFRSMRVNADQEVAKLKQQANQYSNGPFFKMKNDPRITAIGRLIRKTSLDELPQLFNVLKGDMSLVGNRPLPLYEADQLTRDAWAKRFLAPAGMTGLWQISKRGKDDMSTEERINLDIEYSDKYSLRYDIGILMRTLPAMIQKENV